MPVNRRRPRARLFLALLAPLLLAACATRPATGDGDLALAKSAKLLTNSDTGQVLARPKEGTAVVYAAGARHNVLVLSGGGSDGAFGAGVLVGWTETGKRPDFDVVTGVSTGALMATFAFLGPDHDPQLRQVYTALDDKDIYRSRGLLGIFKGSLKSQAPLEKTIAAIVDDALIERVAAEHAKGRRLYVATTNLDTGLQVTWDMGKIASSASPDKARLYRQILAASAAIPGVFQPIYIESLDEAPSLHVDGGVHSAVLFHSFMIAPDGRDQNVWAIVNGQIHYKRSDGPANPNVGPLLERSVGEMLASITDYSIYKTYVRANHGGARFHLAYIPDDVPETDPIRFVPTEMGRLFEAGRAFAKGNKWASEPPRLEADDRVRP
jgi:predicted acylesterase/phospholipase RssA